MKYSILGILALAFYLIHGYVIILDLHPANLLWICHFGNVILAVGLWGKYPYLVSCGFFWLLWGNAMWLFYLFGNGELFPTSLLTHVGGMIIAIAAVRDMGLPKFSWLAAVGSMFFFQRISFYFSPESENINLSQKIPAGWGNIFPSYGWYLVLTIVGGSITFYIIEILLRKKLLPAPKVKAENPTEI
jgi:hypothetical protein